MCVLKVKPVLHSNLSDNEEESLPLVDTSIDDLDPDLAALVSNPSSMREERQAQKIQLKIQYVHNIENISGKAKPILDTLMKPIRIYIMDASCYCKSNRKNRDH